MDRILKIHNGKILTPYRIISGTVVVVEGKIKEVAEGNIDVPGAVEIDAKGKYISPGFIDIHVHGGGGHDFMDGSEEAFLKIAETHAKYGTTGLMPTTLTSELDELRKIPRVPSFWGCTLKDLILPCLSVVHKIRDISATLTQKNTWIFYRVPMILEDGAQRLN
jgi:hypothetical protein